MDAAVRPEFSLFALIDRVDDQQHIVTSNRNSMAAISYRIEDAVIHGGVHTHVFAGFQKLSYFPPNFARYEELSRVAEHIWVFAIPDTEPPRLNNVTYVPLSPDDALVREWFLVVDSPECFTALVARDISGFDVPHRDRLFTALWTFDSDTVNAMQRGLSTCVGLSPRHYTTADRDFHRQLSSSGRISRKLIGHLEKQNADLQRLQQQRDDMVSMLVHDLRSPLASMNGYLEMARTAAQRGILPDVQEFIGEAMQSGEGLRVMIANILDISRMESGEFQLQPSHIPVLELFEEQVQQHSAIFRLQGVALRWQIDEEVCDVYGDHDLLTRVLNNLVSNALRYTPKGGRITMSATCDPVSGVRIAVMDTGQGVPLEAQSRIFEKFRQASSSDTRRGTGLGLAFCKLAIEAHGGQISVHNAPDAGAIFWFTLPESN